MEAADDEGPGPQDVWLFDPAVPPGEHPDRPSVRWVAPGSVGAAEVAAAWSRRALTTDLAGISGPWAAVLWCPRSRGHVLVADPVGVQPLYRARTDDGRVAVASWLAALVDRPDIDDTVDPEGLLLDTGLRWRIGRHAHRTGFRAVERVVWGRALHIGADGSTRWERYWDPASLPGPDDALSLGEAAELLRERLDAAIRRLVPSGGPAGSVGAHVSSGLDCTAVACRAHAVLTERGDALSAGYSWSPDHAALAPFDGDERALIDDVAERLGRPVRYVVDDEQGDWYWRLDPARYPRDTQLQERFVLPRARADGVTVLLSGWGGDEFASFNGRGVARWQVRHGRFGELWQQSRQRLLVERGAPAGPAATARRFTAQVFHALPDRVTEHLDRELARRRRAHDADTDARLRAFSPLVADARLEQARRFAGLGDHRAWQLALLDIGHLQHRTASWHQTGRLFGVQYRYPLLDVGLVEAALQLPRRAFLSHGWTRTAFRLAIEPWVPPSVAWNPYKYEPARLWPPQQRATARSTPEPARPMPDHPGRRAVAELLESLGGPVGNRIPDTARVRPRPEAAPRL